ncbi:MAG: hypothetical protein PVG14_14770 [Anaerolineales bacterium]|jgi:hypothetical protein
MITLDELVTEHLESLVDSIVKDAVSQIPSYWEAPLARTIERTERWLKMLATSVHENDPQILERYLVAVAHERQKEGYPVVELHTIVQITESRIQEIIEGSIADKVERNALSTLLEAVMGAARMVLSVSYVLITGSQGT